MERKGEGGHSTCVLMHLGGAFHFHLQKGQPAVADLPPHGPLWGIKCLLAPAPNLLSPHQNGQISSDECMGQGQAPPPKKNIGRSPPNRSHQVNVLPPYQRIHCRA